MELNKFSWRRVASLIKEDFRIKAKIYLLLLGLSFGISLVFFYTKYSMVGEMVSGIGFKKRFIGLYKFHIEFFPWIFIITGFVFASLAFKELGQQKSMAFYLNLPAKTIEKWLSKLIVVVVFYSIIYLVGYSLLGLLFQGLVAGSGIHMLSFSLLDPVIQWSLLYYLVFQSIFFLGSVALPRFSFIKTLVVFLLVAIVSNYLFQLVASVILPEVSLSELGFPGILTLNKALGAHNLSVSNDLQAYWTDLLNYSFFHYFAFGMFPILLAISYYLLLEKKI